MATAIPQAGARMSLISKADIRYEGVLSHIDMANSEICLTQVQSFGTEQRPVAEFVSASADKFDCIVFKGADIKDLTVLDQPPPEGSFGSSNTLQADPSAALPAPPAPQQPAAAPAPSPWGLPQQQYREPQWGPPQLPSAPAAQGYNAQAGGAPSQSAPGFGDSKPQPSQAPLPAGTARPQPAPAPTVVITPARAPRVPPPPQQPPPAPSAPHGPPGLQQQSQANGPPASQMPNGGPARPAPQEGSSQAPTRSRPPPSYANAAGGGRGRGGRGRGPPPPGMGRGPMPQGRGPPGRGPGRGQGEPPVPRAPPVPVPAEDFNFEEGIQKFNKEELEQEVEKEIAPTNKEIEQEVEKETAPTDKVYEKDDFFDQLSCEALERLSVGGGGPRESKPPPRARFAEQRKLDIETFGGTGIARRNNFGRGRGRRGGRGGPGGRGRGQGPPPAQAPPVPAA